MDNPKKRIWTNELSIGNIDADNEHKKLLEIFDDLVEFIENKKEQQEFAEILSKMTDYSLNHFKNEEEYMRKLSYPKLAEHKNYHKNYIYKVAMYNVDLLSVNPPDPKEIIEFLEKWWTNHILIYDMDYENYKKAIKSDTIY
jgi:hemerythrin